MPFANLMDSLICREVQKSQEKERKFRELSLAVLILEALDDSRARFLAKRLEQGRATCSWDEAYTDCLRLTVKYRGGVWRIRVPVPA